MIRNLLAIIGIVFSLTTLGSLSVAFPPSHNLLMRKWSRFILKMLGIKLQVHGLRNIRNQSSKVVIMNHESALDIPIMMAALPLRIRFMAKKELFKIPLFGWIINLARHIPIDREHPRRAISTINKVSRELIHQNYCIVVSPEGRRSYDGRIAPFKKGAFKLAERYKLPILPVLILGARHCVPNKKISIVPGSVEVYIEPEVQIDSYPNLTACVEDLHQRMSTQKERYENNRNRGSHA